MEYTLSDFGNSFMDVLAYIKTWGDQNLPDAAVSRVCSDPTQRQRRDTAEGEDGGGGTGLPAQRQASETAK